ncbi:MAG: hypothetical protein HFF44_00625 [Lawsonibacter sp.]|nr:hypothetical protein [Lawsonibacter sp.]
MKRLWTMIPPCMSDILGLQALMNNTAGIAVVDDASSYKPLRFTQGGEGRPENRRGPGGKHNGYFGVQRMVSSEIREANVITGTAEQVWTAVETGMEAFHPDFILLATAPCAAMIGSDLEETADRIQAERQIPAAAVKLDGQKDYLYGTGMALEAMGRLLLEKRDTRPNTVNLLGCNTVDWSEDMVWETETWLSGNGWQVLSLWGSKETTDHLKIAAAASVNLVVNVSGLRLARYMEVEFGIPYVVGAPFGAARCIQLLEQLSAGGNASLPTYDGRDPEALVIGEQLAADAIRSALEARGLANVKVCSFFEMGKGLMRPGDKKLVSEDELAAELNNGKLRVVFGDIDYRLGSQVKWVPLPNQGNLAPSRLLAPFSMTDGALDRWLDEVL